VAGFPVFLIRGKDDKIRTFHNVCRHRAYTITRKETGASGVLGCRYHGWSYDTYGRLVKAPKFDDVPGFEKSENSLFEIHTHTTDQGSVFVNLDSGEPVPVEDSILYALIEFTRHADLGIKSEWLTGQTLTGAFNWKLGSMIDWVASSWNTTDIYAANARHFVDLTTQLEQRLPEILQPSIATRIARAIWQKNQKANCSLFPGTFLYSFAQKDMWFSLTFLPSSETSTRVRYDLFTSSPKTGIDGDALNSVVEEVIRDFITGIEFETQSVTKKTALNSPATYKVLKQLQEHQKLERISGGLVRPAMRQPKGSSLFQQAEQCEFPFLNCMLICF
jgi:nitrite reductase/ring-hydroxylating ferredoxin subunit